MKRQFLLIAIVVSIVASMGAQTIEKIKYGDFQQWIKRDFDSFDENFFVKSRLLIW